MARSETKEIALQSGITAKQRYSALETDRQPFLDRARQCAALTIPAVMPPAGFGPSSQLPTPYQSLGARGVRTLASKLLLSLFPSVPFFNYRIDDLELEKLGQKRGEIEEGLSRRERAVVLELDTSAFRPVAFTALTHLVITGNILVYVPTNPDQRAQVYRLDQYVVRRDHAGNLLEIVLQEKIDFMSLPEEVRAQLASQDQYKGVDPNSLTEHPVELYTHIYFDGSMWKVYQEADSLRIPGTEGSYKKDELPYFALRLVVQPGEDYGRSYVEEYLGDLDSLEALSETLVEGSAASARIIFMVHPGGTTSLAVVAKAKNGDVVSGNAEDVSTLQVQKQADLSVAKDQALEIANRLSYAFLLHAAVQRKGERVTAEEIRYMASELDDALGGIYTLLAVEFQLPIVKVFEKRMEKRTGAPKLPENTVRPVIVAGLEAIGRGHDQQNLRAWVTEILQTLGPELAMKFLKPLELMKRSAASYSIDTNGLIPTEDELQQQMQREQMMAMLQQFGPEAMKQMGGMGQTVLKAGLENNAQGTPNG